MALALAAKHEPRIDALVLDSPFTSPRELVQERARYVPVAGPLLADWMLLLVSAQTGANFFTASTLEALSGIGKRPVMIVHGDRDVMMPESHARRLYAAVAGPKSLWLGPGSHSNIITTDPAGYAERLFAFLNEHLGPVPMPARTRPAR